MVVVVIIGVLAALAMYGVQKYVSSSKTTEARTMIGKVSKDASAIFEAEQMAGVSLAPGTTAGTVRSMCATAAAKVPTSIQPEGTKYMPAVAEWQAGDTDTGWACLKFQVDSPIYFMYGYRSNVTAGANAAVNGRYFTASAQARMDGQFRAIHQTGIVDTSGGSAVLKVMPSLCDEQKTAVDNTPQDPNGDCILQ
jgi:type IV pilus assembly protein PilA